MRSTTNIVIKIENSSYLTRCYRMLDSQNSWSHLIGLPCIIYVSAASTSCWMLQLRNVEVLRILHHMYNVYAMRLCACVWVCVRVKWQRNDKYMYVLYFIVVWLTIRTSLICIHCIQQMNVTCKCRESRKKSTMECWQWHISSVHQSYICTYST